MSDEEIVWAIADGMDDEAWKRAELSSHRPENVMRWWLDANARFNLAEAALSGLRASGFEVVGP